MIDLSYGPAPRYWLPSAPAGMNGCGARETAHQIGDATSATVNARVTVAQVVGEAYTTGTIPRARCLTDHATVCVGLIAPNSTSAICASPPCAAIPTRQRFGNRSVNCTMQGGSTDGWSSQLATAASGSI